MKQSTILSLFTSALCLTNSNALVDMAMIADCPLPAGGAALVLPETAAVSDAITWSSSSSFSAFAESPIGSSTLALANTIALPVQAAATFMSSPDVESEFLEDMAHVALDFAGIFRPSKSTMRLFSIGGRLMSLMADYLPDHSIRPEELLVHLFFMGMTVQEVIDDDLDFDLDLPFFEARN